MRLPGPEGTLDTPSPFAIIGVRFDSLFAVGQANLQSIAIEALSQSDHDAGIGASSHFSAYSSVCLDGLHRRIHPTLGYKYKLRPGAVTLHKLLQDRYAAQRCAKDQFG